MNNQKLIILSLTIVILFLFIIWWGDYLINQGYIIENITNMYPSSTNYTVDVPLTTTLTCENMCGPNNRCFLTGEQCTTDIDCYGCRPFNKTGEYIDSNDSYSRYMDNSLNSKNKYSNNSYKEKSHKYDNIHPYNNHHDHGLKYFDHGDNILNGRNKNTNLSDSIKDNINSSDESSIRAENDAGKLTLGVTPKYSTLTTDIGSRAKLINKADTKPPKYFQGFNTWRETYDAGMELFDKRYSPTASYFTPNYPKRLTLSGEFIDDGPLAANDFLKI
jgi:ABC-type antimicrobial peptide transport system permease subunit